MKKTLEEQRERSLLAQIAYSEKYVREQTKALGEYFDLNGAGAALGEVLGECISQNNKLIQARKDLTQLRLDREGLFAIPSGPGAQPART